MLTSVLDYSSTKYLLRRFVSSHKGTTEKAQADGICSLQVELWQPETENTVAIIINFVKKCLELREEQFATVQRREWR